MSSPPWVVGRVEARLFHPLFTHPNLHFLAHGSSRFTPPLPTRFQTFYFSLLCPLVPHTFAPPQPSPFRGASLPRASTSPSSPPTHLASTPSIFPRQGHDPVVAQLLANHERNFRSRWKQSQREKANWPSTPNLLPALVSRITEHLLRPFLP